MQYILFSEILPVGVLTVFLKGLFYNVIFFYWVLMEYNIQVLFYFFKKISFK